MSVGVVCHVESQSHLRLCPFLEYFRNTLCKFCILYWGGIAFSVLYPNSKKNFSLKVPSRRSEVSSRFHKLWGSRLTDGQSVLVNWSKFHPQPRGRGEEGLFLRNPFFLEATTEEGEAVLIPLSGAIHLASNTKYEEGDFFQPQALPPP